MYTRWLFIFRQDLRREDNTALFAVFSRCQEVVPIFIFDEQILSGFTRPDGRIGFLVESLCTLQQRFLAQWNDLLVFHGKSEDLIPRILAISKANACFRNRSYGTWALHRDVFVRDRCAKHQVACHTASDYLLVEPDQLPARKVFSPFYRLWQQLPKLLPEKMPLPVSRFPQEIDLSSFADVLLDLTDTHAVLHRLQWIHQTVWNIKDAVQKYKKLPLLGYDEERNRPDISWTSMLSPYLRFWCYSPRQILSSVLDYTTPGTIWEEWTVRMEKKSFHQSFVSELAWREFWRHIYHHFPESRQVAFQEKRRAIRWQNNETWFAAWQEWRTGYPIVDAGMRQLKSMYRMHGRVRMIVASFLCKDLLIDRHRWEKHFANWLLDYDEAVNMGNRQRSASVGADPKPLRIFNPLLQSQKFDPQARYIKTRLPELAHHTPEQLHDPLTHKLDRYAPIVNHFEMSKLARALYKCVVQEKLFE